MPDLVSFDIVRSESSASIVDDENPVSFTALFPKTTTATRSEPALSATNARAPSTAAASLSPAIDCERSTATTTLLDEARFCRLRSTTLRPFSLSVGAWSEATGATSVARIVG